MVATEPPPNPKSFVVRNFVENLKTNISKLLDKNFFHIFLEKLTLGLTRAALFDLRLY
jgi:hypothetical protein